MIENFIEDLFNVILEPSNIIATFMIIIAITIMIIMTRDIFSKLRLQSRKIEIEFKELSNRLDDQKTPKKLFEKAIMTKREKILNISNIAYHYLDRKAIKSYYYQYFRKPIVTKIETEVSHQNEGELIGTVPRLIEGKSAARDISKEKTIMELPDVSEEEMFLIYQKEIILREQVTVDLEILDIDLTELNQFNEKIIELENNFGLTIPDTLLKTTQMTLKNKATEKMKNRLENVTSWVIVEGNFEIKDSKEYFVLNYLHPISDYLNIDIFISSPLPKDKIEPSFLGNYENSIGKYVPITVYGKIWQTINIDKEIYEIIITPYVVY